ncbi:hypothetical protein [Desulfobulbus elongatus]|uniref:hypothetical protein n=1 Tax=Desulfobulbus elongatus TaxID=53332 RepID=UPI0012F8F9FE|nr:hypothetical protein [Desulfobulbus elongatus]
MKAKNLPEKYEGYNVPDLLNILKELQSKEGTTAPREMITTMGKFVKEYRLAPVHQVHESRIDGKGL